MSETLILAAIIAPLVLVPAIIVSFMADVNGLWWPHTPILIEFGTDFEPSPFLDFERVMLEQICRRLEIPKELLTEPCEPIGYSYFAESLKCYRRFGGWL